MSGVVIFSHKTLRKLASQVLLDRFGNYLAQRGYGSNRARVMAAVV